jgi:uncharacterized membrane protein
MKDQLLNDGLTATENKHMTISDLKTGIIIMLVLVASILSCTTCTYCSNYHGLSKMTEYNDSLQNEKLATQQATINELTHDNMNLVNNK